jgi:antirestriction protein ArdC
MAQNHFKAVAGKNDIYRKITDQIIASLESGARPWAQPWQNSGETRIMRPLRSNGQAYGGINTLMLWAAAHNHGFNNPNWMTVRQANALGGHVMKGEHSTPVVYASEFTKTETKDGEVIERQIPFLRAYNVFNVQQIEGLPAEYYDPAPSRLSPDERIQNAEEFFASTGADIRHGGNRAFYALNDDYIRMPDFGAFKDPESYYATLAHEITHWTRHPSRLARDFGREKFGDEGYSKEEIVAELGSAFLCSELDLTPELREENAAYIDHWIKAMKADKHFIFQAAGHAQKAADFVISAHQPAIGPDFGHDVDQEHEVQERPVAVIAARNLPRPGM